MVAHAHPLKTRTSFRIGGEAEHFVEPVNEGELRDALALASDNEWPVRALGGGKNLLVDDRGVKGMVIGFSKLKGLEVRGTFARAAAGTSLPVLLKRTMEHGLAGFENLAGVPGTVGGALRMNAGGSGGWIGEHVAWVAGYDRAGETFRFTRDGCGFRYRGSRLGGLFITEAAFRLSRAGDGIAGEVDRIFSAKRESQPLTAATAGCVFKNPDLPKGESAGYLLEQENCKGLAVGGAAYSDMHANFIVNRGGATFRDVYSLIREGRRRVFDTYGVYLDLEVEVWKLEEEEALLVA